MTRIPTPKNQTRDALAEEMSKHGLIGRAAADIGISPSYARVLWAEIRAGLGAQAA